MTQFIETTGRSEEDAIGKALAKLCLDRDDVSVEVLERAKKGMFGFGGNPAKVRVSYDDGKEEILEKKEDIQVDFQVKEVSKNNFSEKSSKKVGNRGDAEEKPTISAMTPAQEKVAVSEKIETVSTKKPVEPEVKNTPFVKEQGESRKTEGFSNSQDKTEKKKPEKKSGSTENQKKRESRSRSGRNLSFTEEEQKELCLAITKYLEGLMLHLHIEASPQVSFHGDSFRAKLNGENLGSLIGRRGETLDAIQQLTSYSMNKLTTKRLRIFLDAENYREKREETLCKLAEKVAGEVVKHRRNVTLESMNAYERHIIHAALENYPNVSTYSTGSDPNRRTVVAYQQKRY